MLQNNYDIDIVIVTLVCRMTTMQDHSNFSIADTVVPRIVFAKTFFIEFNLMYCDLCSQYIQVQKLFKGGNYSRAIRGNTVFEIDPCETLT